MRIHLERLVPSDRPPASGVGARVGGCVLQVVVFIAAFLVVVIAGAELGWIH